MKRIILLPLFFGLIFSISTMGQGILNEYNTWNVLVEDYISNDADTEILHFEGDSALGGYNYKIIVGNYYGSGNSFLGGLLREESNRIYYIHPDAEEGLLYDFNLNIGDTATIISMFKYDNPFQIHITNIDTVNYFGINRLRWFLEDNYGNEDYWVAGIGSSHGPVHTLVGNAMPPYLDWNLLCHHHNDTLIYIKEGYSNCIITHVDIHEFSLKEDIVIYPNPAIDRITINSANESIFEVQIINMQGKLLQRKEMVTSPASIDISGLDHGTYIIKLLFEDKSLYEKLIKR